MEVSDGRNLELALRSVRRRCFVLRHLELIKRFRLNCGSFCLPSNIDVWIHAIMERKVEELELSLSFEFNMSLPSGIFICSTLRVLTLNRFTINTPSSVYLPSLKVMHLESVYFPDFNYVAMLLSGCAILEDLILKSICSSKHESSGNIEGLRQLVRADVPSLFVPTKVLYNVEFLRLGEVIWTPSHDIPIFHNLTHIEFGCFAYDWDWVVKWLQNCPMLQILVIQKIVTLSSNLDEEERLMEPKHVPQCLSSHLKEFCLRGYSGFECELQLARLIMKNARVLRTISITICCTSSSNAEAKPEMIKRLSSCPRGSATCKLLFD